MSRLREATVFGPLQRSPAFGGAAASNLILRTPDPHAGLREALGMDQAPRRRRLWELSGYLHCSIIGTCLSTAELRQILIKAQMTPVSTATDHELHSEAVHAAGRHDGAAKLLNKALDRRHGLAIKRFARAKTEPELHQLWEQAVEQGEIPGAYWAALTHPQAKDTLIRRVFGDVHMLSHLVGAANRADIRRLRQLESENAALQSKAARQQDQLRDAILARDAEIRNLRQLLVEALAKGTAEPAGGSAGSASEQATLGRTLADLEHRLSAESRRRERAEARLGVAETALAEATAARHDLERRERALQAEVGATEAALAAASGDGAEDPEPIDLGGRSILYVGGRAVQTPHFRRAAEQWHATLLHHDGGVEDQIALLAGLISRADMVMFPVDCVSHGAVATIKRLCRNAAKPYRPLRSASLASFVAGLRGELPVEAEAPPA
ncbi:MAG TPA: DUF2325 domain-containing protein [Hypericibacter adhaerens]|jgi:hypothetical protein|uniref:DUF2325 domain-containing protein n=1 Tax=Hypericibacter adhaerens TaxID=2602016 RepID=A0A5J6MSX1_9PROT|nr:DUF2325 domain-containing protein [Hypericibacter adhaerens]QEX20722.1 hypothetical protein FRZ61_06410 [Hypericibacter adhaerens]HWA42530.1 DUF2325 domain-containing protein [Hypericibacter adhaerens]